MLEQTFNKKNDGELAIETKELVKTFGKKKVVDGLDLAVPAGSVYAILGPNGAGKTTTLRTLSTLLKPDSGIAKVLGYDLFQETHSIRKRISLTGQFASIDETLSGKENLVLIARLLGFTRKKAKERANELLRVFNLEEAADKQLKKYSGGMRRRIDIAASIVVSPDLLFLDEPTTGIDPRSRNEVWNIVRSLNKIGTTVLLTTQYLDEADQLADRIAVIDKGKVIAEGTSGELKASVGSGTMNVRLKDPNKRNDAKHLLGEILQNPIQLLSDPEVLSAQVSDTAHAVHALGELIRADIIVTDFSLGQPSLDEAFLALTNHKEDHL